MAFDLAVVERAATWAGIRLTPAMVDQLETFAAWLRDEARPGGGLGPREAPRLVERHVADSIVFAAPLANHHVERLVDLGSGAGLPGIPLAVMRPGVEVTLVDRSGRRCDLARRAVRVVRLSNVTVQQCDLFDLDSAWDAATMRAVLPMEEAIPAVLGTLRPGGVGVVGLARGPGPAAAIERDHVAVVHVPPGVLDSPVTLLRMTAA